MFDKKYGFDSRNQSFIVQSKKNATDPINALLNYGYSVLAGEMCKFVCGFGLDPYCGYMHKNHSHWSNNEYQLSGTIQLHCISHFNNIELVLFPPQTFTSISMVSEKSECSICHKEFSECEHIRGEAYMGQACTETATKIRDIGNMAIVSHPDDKKCRVTHYGDKEPPTINKMTLLDESVKKQE